MISEWIAYLYLVWPIGIGILIVCFFIGTLIALSIGSFFVGFVLAAYYGYIYLKQRGFFEAVWRESRETFRVLNDRICKNIHDTFVLQGHLKEIPEGAVLYIAHPHGLYSMAPFFHWGARLTAWPSDRRVRTAIHSIFFKIPIVRELAEAHGAIEATEESIRCSLEKGESVALLTGGIRELQETQPGRMRLVLEGRKGFLRIAKSLGVPIVPVLSFGENEIFPPSRIAWIDHLQTYMKRWFGIYVPIPTFGSLVNWTKLFQKPLDSKVETWVGKSITTHEKSIERIRKEVFEGIHRIYKEGKPNGYPDDIEIL